MLRRAVNTIASSALALRMTNEALHQAATNRTSEVLDVLSTVTRKQAPRKLGLSRKPCCKQENTKQPNTYHGAQTVRWNFASTEEVSGYSCSMVAKGKPSKFGSCAGDVEGSAEYTLEDGWYKFQVSGEGHAGNVGMSDVAKFMVDLQPPLIVVEKPKPSKQGKLDIGFQVMDNRGSGVIPANVSCLLRNEALEVSDDWVPECTSPVTYDLLEDRYIFNVRAVDRAGLHSRQDHIIIVDSTPPTARITSTRPVGPQPAFVIFKFTGKDEPERIASLVNHYECKLEERTPYKASTADRIKDGSDM
ncbi:hypothetical protein BSKO_07838 [Bryopsis sp. KO-2023]|nr:hypothetical protein BSKO_07838 [Bryopsis sp. KO-2023]